MEFDMHYTSFLVIIVIVSSSPTGLELVPASTELVFTY